jgi:hypothetical protein
LSVAENVKGGSGREGAYIVVIRVLAPEEEDDAGHFDMA